MNLKSLSRALTKKKKIINGLFHHHDQTIFVESHTVF